jgi:hypothetical protein
LAESNSWEKMMMFKFSSMCLVTGVLCAAGGALAAEPVKRQVIPNFATTDKTGWVLDHALGVDDLLPPPTGGPGPVTFDRAHPCAQQLRPRRDGLKTKGRSTA